LFGYTFGNAPRDEDYRRQLADFAAERGNVALHERLAADDPAAAAKLHPNDVRRVIRALEILKTGGKRKSDGANAYDTPSPYDFGLYVLDLPRTELYARIDRRAEQMLAGGLIDEVRALAAAGLTAEHLSMNAIGYGETLRYLAESGAEDDTARRAELADTIKRRTRNYAKRQMTYFRKMKGAVYMDARRGVTALCAEIADGIRKKETDG
jgi:tRNA dimethylallyltransferase